LSERDPGLASGTLALGLICSVPAALPAWLRVAPTLPAVPAAIALVGAASLVVVPLGLWIRRAASARLPFADRALLSGTALSALPLALFGGVLKSTTHHRPLGGATFAVAALCLLALCIGLSFRLLRPRAPAAGGGGASSAWQNLFTLGCGSSLIFAVALGLVKAARPSLVDFLALAGAATAVGLLEPPRWLARRKRWPLLLGWVALVGCALFSLKSPQLARSLTSRAPVSFAPLSWLGDGS
jgi:hypothetical protein